MLGTGFTIVMFFIFANLLAIAIFFTIIGGSVTSMAGYETTTSLHNAHRGAVFGAIATTTLSIFLGAALAGMKQGRDSCITQIEHEDYIAAYRAKYVGNNFKKLAIEEVDQHEAAHGGLVTGILALLAIVLAVNIAISIILWVILAKQPGAESQRNMAIAVFILTIIGAFLLVSAWAAYHYGKKRTEPGVDPGGDLPAGTY